MTGTKWATAPAIDTDTPAAIMALSAVLLGHVLQINDGFFTDGALRWLLIVILLCAIATLRLVRADDGAGRSLVVWNSERIVRTVLIAGIATNLLTLAIALPGRYLPEPLPTQHPVFLAGIAAAALLFAIGASGVRAMMLHRLWFPLMLVTFAVLGLWMIAASPHPTVDLITVYEYALKTLALGKNPYTMVIPNIYGTPDFYPPGLVVGDWVLLGFPYPPLSLLLGLPGQMLGDVRYADLAALIGAAALIGYSRANLIAPLSATLLLTTPRGLFVLEQAWNEPLTLLAFAATVYVALNARRWLPLMLGLLIASKQYMIIALPLAWLLTQPAARGALVKPADRWLQWLKLAGIATLVAAIITLPWVLWNVHGFTRSVILLQFMERFRIDSLSLLSWLSHHGVPMTPKRMVAASAAGLLGGLLISLWRASRTPAGFAAAIALTLLCVFVSSKKAFCNYYFFALGVMCTAVAAQQTWPEATRRDEDGLGTGGVTSRK